MVWGEGGFAFTLNLSLSQEQDSVCVGRARRSGEEFGIEGQAASLFVFFRGQVADLRSESRGRRGEQRSGFCWSGLEWCVVVCGEARRTSFDSRTTGKMR